MCGTITGSTHISTWVSAETKQRFGVLADRLGLTESGLLRRLVDLNLRGTLVAEALQPGVARAGRDSRVYIRLRPEDHVVLRERAAARGMAAATYASFLLRAHLRSIMPLPDREVAELKRSVAALGAIGRNLNQIARTANQTGRHSGPSGEDVRHVLRALEALRDHVKGLIRANTASWEGVDAQARR